MFVPEYEAYVNFERSWNRDLGYLETGLSGLFDSAQCFDKSEFKIDISTEYFPEGRVEKTLMSPERPAKITIAVKKTEIFYDKSDIWVQ